MKKKEVNIGATYMVKVSGKLTYVRVDETSRHYKRTSSWFNGTNLLSGRTVSFTAARCRRAVTLDELLAFAKRTKRRDIKIRLLPVIQDMIDMKAIENVVLCD